MDFFHLLKNEWAVLQQELEKQHLNDHISVKEAETDNSSWSFSTCFPGLLQNRRIKIRYSTCWLAGVVVGGHRILSTIYSSRL